MAWGLQIWEQLVFLPNSIRLLSYYQLYVDLRYLGSCEVVASSDNAHCRHFLFSCCTLIWSLEFVFCGLFERMKGGLCGNNHSSSCERESVS